MAATMKIARHPASWAISPLSVRETIVPARKPVMTVPTTRPRLASSARSPASGITICPATVIAPSNPMATSSVVKLGTAAQAARATADRTNIRGMSRRRFTTSPSGTIRTIPTAYPIWVRVTSELAFPVETPRSPAMTPKSG